jgi:hypothetical protein
MTKCTLTKYADSGHGWLSVLRADLKKLNIADKVTPCSY